MKTLFLSLCAFLMSAAAHAAIPTMNYTCPTGIELHVQAGGYGYINGKTAKLKITDEHFFEVSRNGVSVAVLTNPDGTRSVSYTGKKGANGICAEANFTNQPAAKQTATLPKHMTAYCKGEAVNQFNTKPVNIQTSNPFKTATGYAIKGEGDLGEQGKKPFQCNFDPQGKLQNFQSLVDEGSL